MKSPVNQPQQQVNKSGGWLDNHNNKLISQYSSPIRDSWRSNHQTTNPIIGGITWRHVESPVKSQDRDGPADECHGECQQERWCGLVDKAVA